MAHRDVDRPHGGPGAQRHPDHLTAVHERRPRATRRSEPREAAHQDALGTACGRHVEGEPNEAREAAVPRVGAPVAIHQDEVGSAIQPGEGREDRGQLTPGEEPGNVGKARRNRGRGGLDNLAALALPKYNGGVRVTSPGVVGGVHPRHQPHHPGRRLLPHPPGQPLLQRPGLGPG